MDVAMIIRSGLIRNKDDVSPAAFTKHWLETHGPLALRVQGMRAYSQNHITARLSTVRSAGLHRIDGISQLYFDDVDSMGVAMMSDAQRACIEDLRSFLSDVTLVIQREGPMRRFGDAQGAVSKSMFLMGGESSALSELADDLFVRMERERANGTLRFNPVIDRSFNVDASISAGSQVIDAVLELWSSDADAARSALTHLAAGHPSLVVHDAFCVDEHVFSTYQGQSTALATP
jgi:uncharacterized protein (TIGR02118 family)